MAKLGRRFINKIICGDACHVLRQLPSESVDCVVTSPPYWALRDYGVSGQIGLEPSFQNYIAGLLLVFDEVWRVLKSEGTCWVNMGDTYFGGSLVRKTSAEQFGTARRDTAGIQRRATRSEGQLRPKSLAQIPARFAIRMCDRGWILRNEIIWHKPNCMPSSAKDRFTVDFEKIFLFVKARHYYFTQQFEKLRDPGRLARRPINPDRVRKRVYGDPFISAINPHSAESSRRRILERGRNKRCVWRVATKPYRGEHFAVYPPQLIEVPITAGCPPKGIVLDPFVGSGTTALVASRLGRKYVGVELNPRYVRLAETRLAQAAV